MAAVSDSSAKKGALFRAIMEAVLSHYSASISEFKRNPSRLIEEAGGETIAILNHNKPTAYLVPAATYAALSEVLEDIELGRLIEERLSEKSKAVKVSLDESIK